MTHKHEMKVSYHYLGNEDLIKRDMAIQIIKDISSDEFDKLFQLEKIDPKKRDDVLEFEDDAYEGLINDLRASECVLFTLKLKID